jgi:hypothetical protein
LSGLRPRSAPQKKVGGKNVYAWAAVGYNYTSELIRRYPPNENGAINQQIYMEILKKEVKRWPQDWVLEENGASGHGKGQTSELYKWKKTWYPEQYFNRPYSPNLALFRIAGWRQKPSYASMDTGMKKMCGD